MSEVARRTGVVAELAAGLSGYLRGLSAAQLAAASACDQWQVRDVASHLIGGAARQAASMQRGRAGQSGPPDDFAPQSSDAASAANAQRDIRRREDLGDTLLDHFDAAYQELQAELDAFASGAPDSWNTLCWHQRRGPMPAADYVDLRIQELAIHDWDIRSAHDPNAALPAAGVPALLDMAAKWLQMCFRPEEFAGAPPVSFRFELADAPHGGLTAQVANGQFTPIPHPDTAPADAANAPTDAPANTAPADAAEPPIRCTADTFLLFIYGRLSTDDAIAAGRFGNHPNPERLRQFQTGFRGV